MIHALAHTYEVARRETLVKTDDVRVQVMDLAEGQSVPWHKHSVVEDTFVCLSGPMRVRTDGPDGNVDLAPGGRLTVAAGIGHQVTPLTAAGCSFLLIQATGGHDFIPLPDPG